MVDFPVPHGSIIRFVGRAAMCGALACAALPCVDAQAQAYRFRTRSLGHDGSTYLYSINDAGVIVGDLLSNGAFHCTIVKNRDKAIIVDSKGSGSGCFGLNDAGKVVGYYNPSRTTAIGFIYSNGTFTDLAVPGAPVGVTVGEGISNKGIVVGQFTNEAGQQEGFIFDGTTYTTLAIPGASYTVPTGINNKQQISLQATLPDGPHSYLLAGSQTTEIKYPGAAFTYAHQISNKGLVALSFVDGAGLEHGGVYDANTGVFYGPIDDPAYRSISVRSINDDETLLGYALLPHGKTVGIEGRGHVRALPAHRAAH